MTLARRCVAPILLLAASGPWVARGGDAPSPPPHRVEALEGIAGVLDGTGMLGPNQGWFHPGLGLYGWDWLAGRRDADGDGKVVLDEFRGPPADFDRLDRDRDGAIEAEDFDWSEASPYLRQGGPYAANFRRLDADRDGLVSRAEWEAVFARGVEGGDAMTPEEFRRALTPPSPPPPPSPEMIKKMEADFLPPKATLLRGIARGEVGSIHEGPRPGRMAPEFVLPSRDGSRRVTLAEFRGVKPVVLAFGNVTCGPFRSRFAQVEDLNRRHGDRAAFLLVYVREAHPIDGWRMVDNDDLGIAAHQPTTFDERKALADLCSARVKAKMPILVDGLDDRVGHLYSGMPSRLYVIDRDGRVTYQSGRGPFGFKPGEMEQALLLTLMAGPSAAESGPK